MDGTGDPGVFGITIAFVHGGETLELCIGDLAFKFGERFERLGETFEKVGETFEIPGEFVKVGDVLLVDLTGVLNSYPLFSVGKSSYMLFLGSI